MNSIEIYNILKGNVGIFLISKAITDQKYFLCTYQLIKNENTQSCQFTLTMARLAL